MSTAEPLSPASMIDIKVEKTNQNSLEVGASTADIPALDHSVQEVKSVDFIEQKAGDLSDNEKASAEGNATKRLE